MWSNLASGRAREIKQQNIREYEGKRQRVHINAEEKTNNVRHKAKNNHKDVDEDRGEQYTQTTKRAKHITKQSGRKRILWITRKTEYPTI